MITLPIGRGLVGGGGNNGVEERDLAKDEMKGARRAKKARLHVRR